MAQPGDEARLFEIFATAHTENGYGAIDADSVRGMIDRACKRDGVAIALVDGPERIEAVIGLHPRKQWYASDDAKNWFWEDLLIYVHPQHRRSRHAVKLFHFAVWWEQHIKMPVILGLMPKDDFASKERLFSRFGHKIGSLFLIGGNGQWPGVPA